MPTNKRLKAGDRIYQRVIPAVGGGFCILQERERDYATRLSKRVWKSEKTAAIAMSNGRVAFEGWERN